MKLIFLSSCFADPKNHRLRLRDRVVQMTGGTSAAAAAARPIWMGEDYPELLPASPWPQIDKAEFCLDGVRAAECFVAVITRRHGSAIAIDGVGTMPSSFFEAELFEAALLQKPSFVFLLDGYEPDPKLASLLRLLAPFFPHMMLKPVSEDQIIRSIERLIRHYQRPRWIRPLLARPQLPPTVNALFRARHRAYDVRTETLPLRYLDGLFDPALSPPEASLVRAVLDRAANAPRNQSRLMLLWFAIRALMGAPFDNPAFADLLQLWSQAFEAWVRTGAWYGIHGHTGMGCLAALGSLSEVRVRLATSDPRQGIPHGALASEYYSTARLAGRSGEILALSLSHIQAAVELGGGDAANNLAIRASIYREMGNNSAALADYGEVVDRRSEAGGAPYGEAQSELGFALMLSGDSRRGINLMEQGLALLRKAPVDGFQTRAIRKLAIGYARQGKLLKALEFAVEAHDAAIQIGAYDQIRRLERLAKRIDRAQFWRH